MAGAFLLFAVLGLLGLLGGCAQMVPQTMALRDSWPTNLTAGIALGNQYYARGELNEAERALRNAVEFHPDSAMALNNLAQVISDQGKHQEALILIDRAQTGQGEFAEAVSETRELIQSRLSETRRTISP